jgi:hypothetical protein
MASVGSATVMNLYHKIMPQTFEALFPNEHGELLAGIYLRLAKRINDAVPHRFIATPRDAFVIVSQ